VEVNELTDIERQAIHVVDAVSRIDDHYLPVPNPQVGDAVYLYSRGKFRRGLVSKVTKTRVEVTYTTEGAIRDAMKDRDLYASGTAWSVRMEHDQPEQWNRQSEEWRARVHAKVAAAKRGEYALFVNFTRKTVKREAIVTR
jgi:hypothetical protein